jgi:hypothetical protein
VGFGMAAQGGAAVALGVFLHFQVVLAFGLLSIPLSGGVGDTT